MPFNPEKEEDFLLNDYFIQWSTRPDEESDRFWKKWMEDNPDKCMMVKGVKEAIQSFKPIEYSMDKSVDEEILNNILIRHQRTATKKLRIKTRFLSRRTLSVAASFLLVGFISACLVYFISLGPRQEVPADPEWVTKTAKIGSKLSFALPDGSLVRLNADSSIEYPTEFSDSIREVRITGQAFFEVEHLDSLPFIVQAGDLKVEVLGTSFDVQTYPGKPDQVVALLTGKVSISTEGGLKEVLHPMEMLSYSSEKKEMVKKTYEWEQVLGWKDGIIRFKNTSFTEVFETLERWYGVEISISKTFTGGFNGRFDNESLENVLTGLSFSEDFQFKISGNKVLIF